ncbi:MULTISPECIES: fatty acid desaturase [Psychrobacter]|uniref:acyl-CoA desaturase n=1 Tax=Psychrobacter sp. TaxID=56811 RepID=UPI000EBAAB7C|nr:MULTISPECIES: fatty acid desaturase [Psychrobacter]HCT72945.1 fatty acid desaturase [Psychrobacter sp.]
MIAKKVIGLPLKGLRFAVKSGDTLIQHAGTQALRIKTWLDTSKSKTDDAADKFSTTSGNEDANAVINYEGIDPLELEFQKSPINLVPAIFLIATPIAAAVITPWYLLTHQVSAPVWGVFGAFMVWTGISITAGYHRLLSHRAYKAHPLVKNFLLLGSTLAVQGSAFDWVSGHRTHHRHVDDRMEDPYSAQRGFFFSHIGWMLRSYPSGRFDYKNIPDLTKDKVLQIQHKYYGLWVLATNVAMVAAVGWLVGDVWGTLVLAGLLRLVLTHHFTFFINSLCHMFGTRPYTDTNSARDNFFLAIFTWGEGYHNYHHFFQYDYRNGVKWWQYDPTKWLIVGLSKLGLTSELRTVDDTTIKHAEVQMQFKKAQQQIDTASVSGLDLPHAMKSFQDRIKFEYDAFMQTVEEWQALKAKTIELKKTEYADRLHEVDDKLKHDYAKIEQKILEHNSNLKTAFRSIGISKKAA